VRAIRDVRALRGGVVDREARARPELERRDPMALVVREQELAAVGIDRERLVADRDDPRAGERRCTAGVLAGGRDMADELEPGVKSWGGAGA